MIGNSSPSGSIRQVSMSTSAMLPVSSEFRLSTKYQTQFETIIADVGREPHLPDEPMSTFWPMRGVEFHPGQGLMLVGRAVNGWASTFELARARDPQGARDLAATSRQDSEKVGMDWVTNFAGPRAATSEDPTPYNSNRSRFWSIARLVTAGLPDAG